MFISFKQSFKHMIGQCLMKDPRKRPTAKKLLKHPFFKQARSQDYINKKMLDGLPMLGDQYQALKVHNFTETFISLINCSATYFFVWLACDLNFIILLITGKRRSSDGTKEDASWGEGRVISGLFAFVPHNVEH